MNPKGSNFSTAELTSFQTIISGSDYEKIDKKDNPEIVKAKLRGQIEELSHMIDELRIENANLELSQKGLRVLTFAFKEFDKNTISAEDEFNYTFVGLVSMIDPPREESIEAVRRAKIAGIKTIMITGDHKITAGAIAKQIGIMDDEDIALNGVELDKMSDEQLNNILDKVTVYARVSPEKS